VIDAWGAAYGQLADILIGSVADLPGLLSGR